MLKITRPKVEMKDDPIFMAIYDGNIDEVKALLNEDPKRSKKIIELGHRTTLHVASGAKNANTEIIELLIEYGAEIDSAVPGNYPYIGMRRQPTAIKFAIANNYHDRVKCLLKHNATVDNNCLDLAKYAGNFEMFKTVCDSYRTQHQDVKLVSALKPLISHLPIDGGINSADYESMIRYKTKVIDYMLDIINEPTDTQVQNAFIRCFNHKDPKNLSLLTSCFLNKGVEPSATFNLPGHPDHGLTAYQIVEKNGNKAGLELLDRYKENESANTMSLGR